MANDEALYIEGGRSGRDLLSTSLLLAIAKVAADRLLLDGSDVIIVENLGAVFLFSHFLHKLEVTLEALALGFTARSLLRSFRRRPLGLLRLI